MYSKLATALAASVLALAAGQASAAFYQGTIPGAANTNQFLNTFTGGASVQGWYGANVYLVGGPASIKVEYFGAEAGARNTFTFGGVSGCTYTHGAGDGGADGTFANAAPGTLGGEDIISPSCTLNNVVSGVLDFVFTTTAGLSVTNGSNRDNSDVLSNFFVTFDNNYVLDTNTLDGTASGGQSVFLFFDDSGAANDDNHDDMVLRLSIDSGGFQIPEPGSLALVGLTLVAAGLSRRRAKA